MQNTQQERAVVISLDAYRKRRASIAPLGRDDKRDDKRQPALASDALAGIELDEDKAEDTRRLLTMPAARRPDERELV